MLAPAMSSAWRLLSCASTAMPVDRSANMVLSGQLQFKGREFKAASDVFCREWRSIKVQPTLPLHAKRIKSDIGAACSDFFFLGDIPFGPRREPRPLANVQSTVSAYGSSRGPEIKGDRHQRWLATPLLTRQREHPAQVPSWGRQTQGLRVSSIDPDVNRKPHYVFSRLSHR